MSKASVKRVVLSALKSFVGSALAVVVAADVAHLDSVGAVKAIGLAALIAGSDAAAKVIQIALEDK